MKRASAIILLLGLLSAAAAGQTVKVKVRAALYDRDLNLKPVPHLLLKLVPESSQTQPVTAQTSLDGVVEMEIPPGKYHVTTESPVELFDKSYRWEFDIEFKWPVNVLELSNGNAKTAPLSAGRNAHVDELAYHYKHVKDGVVSVWTEFGYFDGFVVDPGGLVLTALRFTDQATWLVVQLDDRRRLPAVLVAQDRQYDVAVLRINPSATPQITSVQLSTDPGALVEGERAFAIEHPGRDKDKKLVTGVISKADSNEIISDVKFLYSGGPLFNSSGEAVGLVQLDNNKWRVRPIGVATQALAEARQKLTTSPAPSPRLLARIPYGEYPAESLRGSGRSRWEKDVYSLKLGDFNIELATPVSQFESANERYDQQVKEHGRSAGRTLSPSAPRDSYDAILMIFAIPRTKMPFWENYGQNVRTNNRGPAILRYKTSFQKMRLLCGDKEVDTIQPGRPSVSGGDMNNRYAIIADESYAGRYVYPHDAISPECGKVTLEVFSTKEGERPASVVLDPKLVARIWEDFEPYRKLLAQQSAAPR